MKNEWLETDLYPPVRSFWADAGFDVRAEVEDCDVVACRDQFWVVTELKTRLNLDVILQAVQRQRLADEVWIAVPAVRKSTGRRWTQLLHLLRRLELGLLLVDLRRKPPVVEIILNGKPFDRERSRTQYRRQQQKMRSEFSSRHGDQNTGGSYRRALMTRYREQALLIAALLDLHGPATPAQLRKLGSDAKTQRKLYDNHYGWFRHLERGLYELDDSGRRALTENSDLAANLLAEETHSCK